MTSTPLFRLAALLVTSLWWLPALGPPAQAYFMRAVPLTILPNNTGYIWYLLGPSEDSPTTAEPPHHGNGEPSHRGNGNGESSLHGNSESSLHGNGESSLHGNGEPSHRGNGNGESSLHGNSESSLHGNGESSLHGNGETPHPGNGNGEPSLHGNGESAHRGNGEPSRRGNGANGVDHYLQQRPDLDDGTTRSAGEETTDAAVPLLNQDNTLPDGSSGSAQDGSWWKGGDSETRTPPPQHGEEAFGAKTGSSPGQRKLNSAAAGAVGDDADASRVIGVGSEATPELEQKMTSLVDGGRPQSDPPDLPPAIDNAPMPSGAAAQHEASGDSARTDPHPASNSTLETFSVILTSENECGGFQHEVKIELRNGTVAMTASRRFQTVHNHFCSWQVTAPVGRSIRISFETFRLGTGLYGRCAEGKLQALEAPGSLLLDYCLWGLPPDVTSDKNRVQLQLSLFAGLDSVEMSLTLQVVQDHERPRLNVTYTSPFAGVVTSPGFDGYSQYPVHVQDSHNFEVPPRHSIMISFQQFDLHTHSTNISNCESRYYGDSVNLYKVIRGRKSSLIWRKCGLQSIMPQVFRHSIALAFISDRSMSRTGFRMTFTIHKAQFTPQQYANGKFDCSVSYYDDFQRHLHCNLFTECQHGEDENLCEYNKGACNGSIAFQDKCYQYFDNSSKMTWVDALNECRKRGWDLASLNTPQEWNAIENALDFGHRASFVFIGLRTADATLPFIYRGMWQWTDQSLAYFVHLRGTHIRPSCAALPWGWDNYSVTFPCDSPTPADFICEYRDHRNEHTLHVTPKEVQFPISHTTTKDFAARNLTVVVCPNGHIVHDFLSCDPSAHCHSNHFSATCRTEHGGTMPSFSCENGIRTLPFTLVCDYKADCMDNSDEEFCEHIGCSNKKCRRSGECITESQWCDGMTHCADGLDEEMCPYQSKTHVAISSLPPPALVLLDGHGNFAQRPLRQGDPCPDTHFRCWSSDDSGYCLPVYLRCNGYYDCPNHEDEDDCKHFSCPGFYRCRGSTVCVHADHMCDGVFHCPQQDDEKFCALTCPSACRCQGLAFVCSQPFPTHLHPHLRYLDAHGSGMQPENLSENFYLMHLNLADCGLTDFQNMTMKNLRVLDLSDNLITTLNMAVFQQMKNLRRLILSNNLIARVACEACAIGHMFLQEVDLSMNRLELFDTRPLSNFSHVRQLNLSFNPLHTLGEVGFTETPHLTVVDLRSTPLTIFPRKLLSIQQDLRVVYADNYRLCCRATLPSYFDVNKCFAPTDEISSCEELLRSNVYRFFLWIFATMATLGNLGSFVYRLCSRERASKVGFDILVTNLSVSDFLMGVYLVIIGGADRLYFGNYIWVDQDWKASGVCQVAGFLSLLSSEVSAFIICLITLDRLLVFRYPFSAVRFRRKSAKLACGLAWAAGFALAAIPLLPTTAHWRFYGQTGICIPLPITRNIVNGRKYSFAVLSVLNLFLFLLIALGQVLIFLSVKSNSFHSDPTRQTRDIAIARTLATIVLTDFVCWFPIALLGLLAWLGVPIPDEFNVGIAIFVLPLNSALNPFLYTFNSQMERRRRATELELIRSLEKRILAELYTADDCMSLNALNAGNGAAGGGGVGAGLGGGEKGGNRDSSSSLAKPKCSKEEAKERIRTMVKVHSSCSLASTDALFRMLPKTRHSGRSRVAGTGSGVVGGSSGPQPGSGGASAAWGAGNGVTVVGGGGGGGGGGMAREMHLEDSVMSLSKQEALALVQDMLDRHVVTLEELSPLVSSSLAGLPRSQVKVKDTAGASGRETPEDADTVTLTYLSRQSLSEEDDVFENLNAVKFSIK